MSELHSPSSIAELDDVAFVARFEACEIPCHAFHHAEHLRLGWIYLRAHGLLGAVERFSTALKRFTAHHGAATKYHATITWAFLFLIHERMQASPDARSWDALARAHPDLLERDILRRYYRPETLASPEARASFVLPDRGLSA